MHAKWRIRGLGAAEAMTHDAIADDLAEVAAMRKADFFNLMEQREKYLAMRQTTGNSFEPDEGEEEADDARQDEQLERQQSLKQIFLKMHEEQRVPAAVTLMTSFTAPGDHHGAFERIDRLRHRLELSAHRALRELRQLRKDLGVDVSALPTCPFLEEIPEDEEELEDENEDTSSASNAQNEPNPDESRAADDAHDTCEQGSRRIEPFAPTKVARRGATRASDVDEEARDRT